MKSKVLCTALLLAAGCAGVAYASPNLLQNGDFSQTTNKPGDAQDSAQFGSQSAYGYTATQFIDGWQGNDGYALWFSSASSATSSDAFSVWGRGSDHDTGNEMLASVTPPPAGGSFVGLDGDQIMQGSNQVQASIGQQVNLTAGQKYTVSFDWGAGQLLSRTGDTTSAIQVLLDGTLLAATDDINNPSHGFTGWDSYQFTFTAGSTGSQFLNFLAVGSPSGLPPISLLSNVSLMENVPEPPELALFGAGLLGLGLLTVVARRRALRSRDAT